METKISLQETAEDLRTQVSETPSSLARIDQERAEWTDAFAVLALDLHDPAVARGAFAMAQILSFHFCETDGDLEKFGERLIDGTLAVAWYVERHEG